MATLWWKMNKRKFDSSQPYISREGRVADNRDAESEYRCEASERRCDADALRSHVAPILPTNVEQRIGDLTE